MTSARALLAGRSWLAFALSVAVAAGLWSIVDFASTPTQAEASKNTGWHFRGNERCFMRKINKRRARHGLRKLEWDKQVGFVSRVHAKNMAGNKGVYHDGNLGSRVTHWRSLAQNTGGGGHCGKLFRSFWHSSVHKQNILGRWRHMGVGAKWRDGMQYVQMVFEHRRNPGNIYHRP